ncbi:MAG TPA: malto-oligosyltrehalose trehalohydrolase, partial [Longimicrobiales bacterium]
EELVFYELHVGTFSAEGTFDGVIPQLDRLRDLGITCLEIMPVAQFAGGRNWGYDGVLPFAVQDTYGGPDGLCRLADAAHARGLAVCLDVVYNHLGPEGNVAPAYGPYESPRYGTPWGGAINFDDRGSDDVRRFFIENALGWVVDYHIDALRLDATHAIVDTSATPFLQELGEAVHRVAERLGRRVYVIAEDIRNDPRLVRPPELGGLGLDAEWNEDFHHALHALLTGERDGYYVDFGSIADLGRAFRTGYVFTGQHCRYRGKRHGALPRGLPASRLVVYAQNHDMIGNRALGERLGTLVDLESLKLAAATVCLSPFLPLLFMGEEYGETAPFQYFISHTDPALIEVVRAGRKMDFASFDWPAEPTDPQAESTFEASRLNPALRLEPRHGTLHAFHRELLRLRREHPVLAHLSREDLEAIPFEESGTLLVRRWCNGSDVALLLHFGVDADLTLPLPPGDWTTRLDSASAEWGGPGSSVPGVIHSDGTVALRPGARSAVLLERG